jgi:hypothetical protein
MEAITAAADGRPSSPPPTSRRPSNRQVVRRRELCSTDPLGHAARGDRGPPSRGNGLSVHRSATRRSAGDPITARIRLGGGEVVDIEREVGWAAILEGRAILSGFLGGRYASEALSLQASLVFEQSYGGVEGDSASLAELCALLSAIGEVPISQSIAMTGSVDQWGRVQPIGGVNEKVEGFFDVCLRVDRRAVTPATSGNLMLRVEVVEAAVAGTPARAVETGGRRWSATDGRGRGGPGGLGRAWRQLRPRPRGRRLAW